MTQQDAYDLMEHRGIHCPFCDEPGFDKEGLKIHLLNHCDHFKSLQELKKPLMFN